MKDIVKIEIPKNEDKLNPLKNNGYFSQKNKISNDKYYTPEWLVEYCVNKTYEIIGKENITEFIEPSAGNGVFLDYLPKDTLAFDIQPEDKRIQQQDYLKLKLSYKKGRCIIGNPPYGRSNNLALQFCNKSFELGDYVAFILAASQYNNIQSIYKFDLIHSEKLGSINFSGRDVKCCFNIYRRPLSGILNNKIKLDNSLIDCKGYRRININSLRQPYNELELKEQSDIAICRFGRSVGKEVTKLDEYCGVTYIKIKDSALKNDIINFVKNIKWGEIYDMTTTYSISNWMIYEQVNKHFSHLIPKEQLNKPTIKKFFIKK